jgi:DNA-binding response OmpR family regulator
MMTEDGRKTCALVIEDDPNIVDLIRSNLAVRGFDTACARSNCWRPRTPTSCCST